MSIFQKVKRGRGKLRLAISGPPGSGKSYTAYLIARGVVGESGAIAVIDTEDDSFPKSAPAGADYAHTSLRQFHPANYIELLKHAEADGFDAVIVDSLSHEWNGPGGILELVELFAAKSYGGNKFAGWKDATPLHTALLRAITSSRCHVIATMRSKVEYVSITDPSTGRSRPEKVGMGSIQRDGVDYEFDLLAEMDVAHRFTVTKARALFAELDGQVLHKPGVALGRQVRGWLDDAPAAEDYRRPNSLPEAAAAEIERLASLAGYSPQQYLGALVKRGVSDTRQLSPADAAEMKARILARLNATPPQPETPAGPIPLTGPTPPAGEDVPADHPSQLEAFGRMVDAGHAEMAAAGKAVVEEAATTAA